LKKYIATTVAALFMISAGSISYAASKAPVIYYNNDKVKSDKNPIIQDGTTYVPLRMLATLFGKDVKFDAKTYQISITDKQGTTATATQTTSATTATSGTSDLSTTVPQQIEALQAEIEQLKSQMAATQSQALTPAYTVPTQTVPTQTVPAAPALSTSDLQGVLNNGTDYNLWRGFQISNIYVSGDNSNITVEADADLKADGNNEHWTDLSQDDVKNYIGKICDKIRANYPNVTITGKVRNTSFVGQADTSDVTTTTQYLANFTSAPDGTLTVQKSY
jgi:hypothetical protein